MMLSALYSYFTRIARGQRNTDRGEGKGGEQGEKAGEETNFHKLIANPFLSRPTDMKHE